MFQLPDTLRNASAVGAFFLLTTLPGCGGAQAPEAEVTAEAAAVVEESGQVDLLAVLAAADKADGAEDRVVSRCAACNLQMDGSADHTLHVEGYELWFCSAGCKDGFAEDTTASLQALDVL